MERSYNTNVIATCRNDLNELLMLEEIMCKQRAKTLWLKEGDRNIGYIHGVASKRKRNNKILRIRDEAVRLYETTEDIKNIFLGYFTNIFTTSNPSRVEDYLKAMDRRIIEDMNVCWINLSLRLRSRLHWIKCTLTRHQVQMG